MSVSSSSFSGFSSGVSAFFVEFVQLLVSRQFLVLLELPFDGSQQCHAVGEKGYTGDNILALRAYSLRVCLTQSGKHPVLA